MKNIKTKLLGISLLMLLMLFPSCVGDLDQTPSSTGDAISSEEYFKDPSSYKQFLAKIYAGLSTSGQQGPAGSPDISGIDEGMSQYVRGLWYAQELTTDLAIVGWGDDAEALDFHTQTWTPLNKFLSATYSRFSLQIVFCNEFLRQTTDAKLSERGVDATLKEEIANFRAETRFMRALTYWHLLDLFGGGSLVDETAPTDKYYPEYASREEIYNFVENELKEVTPLLKPAKGNEAFRADQGAAKMLLAKLYMNSKVYINVEKYNETVPLLNEIIASGYIIHNPTGGKGYQQLFMADNDTNGAQNEFIFTVANDGVNTQNWGGTTFLVCAAIGGKMKVEDYGVTAGWSGLRTTSAFVNKFNGTTDSRANFFTDGQNLEINIVTRFTDGYVPQKFTNMKSDGTPGKDKAGKFVDTDFPIFRLADVYLMYAECAIRGASGATMANALTYVNAIRTRANAPTVNLTDLTLQFVLDERAKELHWEAHRRTDLVRFGKFTGSAYLWPWKAGVANGAPTQTYRDIFPIPANIISANSKLKQNSGYN